MENFLLRDFPIADFCGAVAVDEIGEIVTLLVTVTVERVSPVLLLGSSVPKLTHLPVTEFRLPPYDESTVGGFACDLRVRVTGRGDYDR